ncbi:MAG: ABC transporter substrate-binding protein [Chelatococcus sp.]|uniref:ABC transporter substrate-binding protein n=1 Tax=unclassified Chelatococcus TaxID=2638111 RepID=UPI001BD04586|nr:MULTISPECIES: ABC transporter substrate-binding protein [unclassified Chelatococcus]CAH1649875.1 Hydroxymethylpyrimidine ABC transporter, substrate-binding component [Hyphomicrobiales bacterium]MBS7743384.1 ABC transporter substrate-binding protein [Chelatococcus sp. HY11]MBX3540243.1 ABC transporter substrate-binding protein [Chelatococcus sp.]MBX3541498.1 ABC transporter substrate-binding protein [Chelatococcus sp.]MCO5074609.1 ABC transporter substrate-binding protein [Chelatococcus sp.]
MKFPRFLSLCLALGLSVPAASAALAQAKTPTPVKISMHFNVPQLSWYGLYWADEKGYYKDAGLDVSFQYLRGSPLAVQATGAAQSELGIAAADSALAGGIQGLPIKVIANHLQKDATGVIVDKAKGPVTSFKDLGGKTIVTSDSTTLATLLRAALKRSDMTDKVKVLSVDPQTVCTLMLAERADGCTGFEFAHALQVKAKGVEPLFLPFNTDEYPILGHVIMANSDFLAKNPDAVKAFLAATARGYAEASADIPATVAMMGRIDPTQPKETLPQAIKIIADLTESPRSKEHGWGWMDDTSWNNLYNGLAEGGVLKPGYKVSDLYTNDYLPAKK